MSQYMTRREEELVAKVAALEERNRLLAKTIELQKRQMKGGGMSGEVRRLRAKIAEWEGNTRLLNGGYYHGDRFIMPYLDEAER